MNENSKILSKVIVNFVYTVNKYVMSFRRSVKFKNGCNKSVDLLIKVCTKKKNSYDLNFVLDFRKIDITYICSTMNKLNKGLDLTIIIIFHEMYINIFISIMGHCIYLLIKIQI